MKEEYVIDFENLTNRDLAEVGGKNASLGEMIANLSQKNIRVPPGFAATASAYRAFIRENNLEEKIATRLSDFHTGKNDLAKTGKSIRQLFLRGNFPDSVASAIRESYASLNRRLNLEDTDVAVRSSATAEDLPDASFAGQQESYLNVTGEDALLRACRKCYASLFTDRAITYREEKGFDHMKVALSVGVQKMVRADSFGAGVMFSIDTETGFPDAVLINAAHGLGENVVQGLVTPDEYRVFKPLLDDPEKKPIIEKTLGAKEKKMVYAKGENRTTKNINTPKKERMRYVLSDSEILTLAGWAKVIENHYGKPMDMEWAKDGDTEELFILQARPETVQSQKQNSSLKQYRILEKAEPVITGLSIGEEIAAGKVMKIGSADELEKFEKGAVLVTEMTDPDWVSIMKQASGIVTEQGGRTCHAAIVSRELGIPAVVGTGNATDTLEDHEEVTVSCAEGETGKIYRGSLQYEVEETDISHLPKTRTRIMMNMASPGGAFRFWRLPVHGIGLARMEFIINNIIRIHPLALTRFDELKDKDARKQIEKLTKGYDDKRDYFVEHLARGVAKLAAAGYPDPVILRMSDFKSNEYAALTGGEEFEPVESNPMIGFRGASRYTSEAYKDGFELELRAVQEVRTKMGFQNLRIMIPFCRTVEEADSVLAVMAENGLVRGKDALEIYVMCEIPSNIILADDFSARFDGFSIGSNDLTQLILGVDRDSAVLSHIFDEKNPAVLRAIADLIKTAHARGCKVGICGQAPSDYPEFAEFLVKNEIDSISLNPDSVISTLHNVAKTEGSLTE